MRLSTLLLIVALICAGYISAVQNATIINQRHTIRQFMGFELGPHDTPGNQRKHGDMYVTPMPPHHALHVSEN